MENKLINFLEDYVENPRVLTLSNLPEIEKQTLPETWRYILSNDN